MNYVDVRSVFLQIHNKRLNPFFNSTKEVKDVACTVTSVFFAIFGLYLPCTFMICLKVVGLADNITTRLMTKSKEMIPPSEYTPIVSDNEKEEKNCRQCCRRIMIKLVRYLIIVLPSLMSASLCGGCVWILCTSFEETQR